MSYKATIFSRVDANIKERRKKKDSWESELELAISEMIMHNQNQTEQSALFPSAYSSSVGVGCGCRPMCTSELGDEKASSLEMNYDTNQRQGGKKMEPCN